MPRQCEAVRMRHCPALRASRRPDGLSLVELLIAIAVAALVLATATPSLRGYFMRQSLRAAVTELNADIALARHAAVEHGVNVVICPTGNDGSCRSDGAWHARRRVFLDVNADRAFQASETILRWSPPLARVTATGPRSRPQLRFSPMGSAPASNLSILVCAGHSPGFSQSIVVGHSGRIRLTPMTEAHPPACGDL